MTAPSSLDITVSIHTFAEGHGVKVGYNFTDLQTQLPVRNSSTCVLQFTSPTYCNFTLDDMTQEAGWVFVGLSPAAAPTSVQWWLKENAANTQNYTVLRTLDYDMHRHSFFLNFYNNKTGAHISDDPQEGNITPPK